MRPADRARLRALTATRDALLHAPEVLTTGRDVALEVMARVGADRTAPPDLRGAAYLGNLYHGGRTWQMRCSEEG